MLISRVSEGVGGRAEGGGASVYRSADELLELMSRDHAYQAGVNESLSTRDLVLLYKNLDVGTKLMSDATDRQRKPPNQHVETIVYKDDEEESDESDVSEIYSSEDLRDVFAINQERIDLISNLSYGQHPLCEKFGDFEIQTSNVTSGYDSNFLFRDPYIKQQLQNLSTLPESMGFNRMLPTSLLDYICCKRLDDNYNFYMDNIIIYVQHTIEQLKRISNGDYLTDRAKKKWREVSKDLVIPNSEATKVLATSVSIPIHVIGKIDGHRSTWDDIVHSEVDVRSLTKILEKKIIIEVPKLICGSYKLFSERSADNLVISCKKDEPPAGDREEEGEARVDVVFQLQPSGSGHIISNINSIMILKKIPSVNIQELKRGQPQQITFGNYVGSAEDHPKIVEIFETDNTDGLKNVDVNLKATDSSTEDIIKNKSVSDTSDSSLTNFISLSSSQSSTVDNGLLNRKMYMKTLKAEKNFTLISPDELRCTIRRLNMQTPVLEETEESSVCKKKSLPRVRIKSPYENQSYSLEEKKRKKLLEIREKREMKKLALSENCRITKHKYGKGGVMAQPSNSMTKLSITNKSFYNSIYGENLNHECCFTKNSYKSQRKETFQKCLKMDDLENGFLKSSFADVDRGLLDDTNTETIVQMHNCENLDLESCRTPISPLSNCNTEVSMQSHLVASSGSRSSSDEESNLDPKTKRDEDNMQEADEDNNDSKDLITYQSTCIVVPANTPKGTDSSGTLQDGNKKTMTTINCRKSIDKIYDLLKRIGKRSDDINISSTSQYTSSNTGDISICARPCSSTQLSDSGTSIKHHLVSSNPSTFSFGRKKMLDKYACKEKKKKETPVTLFPKVMISTKLQTPKADSQSHKMDRKRVVTKPALKVSDNPLKAISELLHEFSNVHKARNKTHKKIDNVLADGKTVLRQGSSKKPKSELCTKETSLIPLKILPHKERRCRVYPAQETAQASHPGRHSDDKNPSKHTKRNLSDIIDEAKEARGEAVRGPPKQYSRIDTLAQPKKYYVQAHIDECHYRYGRNTSLNKLQRATLSTSLVEKHNINTNYTRNKRKITESASMPSAKPGNSTAPPLERITKPRRSASNSPDRKRKVQPVFELPTRPVTAIKSPDLKKKMVAVQSYVKSHYGHVSMDTCEIKGHEVQKSRVPLIPMDLRFESVTSSPNAEESTVLGKKLHIMVDTMIHTNTSALSVLTECQEPAFELKEGLEKLSAESLLKNEEPKSESDYPVDVFEDKSILTAVSCIPKDNNYQHKVIIENTDAGESYEYKMQSINSATELQKLENALYQRMSVGAFPKRLRIKNLTLTPKQSLQQVIVLQSGDAGSLLVKSSLSQCLKKTASTTNSLTAIKSLAAISKTNANWDLTNIPLQVATIGYAFPTFQSTQCGTANPCIEMLMKRPSREDIEVTCKCHKTSQCFKGIHEASCIEQATQANIAVPIPSTSNLIIDSRTRAESIRKDSKIVEAYEENENIVKKPEKIQTQILEPCKIIKSQTEKCYEIKPKSTELDAVEPMTEKCKSIKQVIKIYGNEDIIMPTKVPNDVIKSKLSVDTNEELSKARDLTPENVDHSTSLDILMGLLNEIRKITGISINKNVEEEREQNDKELEILLDKAATHESSIDNYCRDIISLSSLHILNPFDSKLSIGSLNISSNGDIRVRSKTNLEQIGTMTESSMAFNETITVDKEVSVEIEKQYVNTLTDAPSHVYPSAINNSTNFKDSLIEILRVPSTQSDAKYETLNRNPPFDNTLEEPLVDSVSVKSESERINFYNDKVEVNIVGSTPLEESVNLKMGAMAVVSKNYKCASRLLTSPCAAVGAGCDPTLSLKRDVLVTLYSLLVLTVFAALSFPRLFLHVEM